MKHSIRPTYRSAIVLSILAIAGSAAAQMGRSIQVEAGKSPTTLSGKVRGDAAIDYVIQGRAGQILSVKVAATNDSLGFNLLPPGSEEAMVNTTVTGKNETSRMLPIDGKYTVRVYLVRAAARRGSEAPFRATFGLSGKAIPALPFAKDARVAGTRFHAQAEVAFEHPVFPQKTCSAGIIRRDQQGTATLVFTSKGVNRRILLVKGKVAASDAAMPVTMAKSGDQIVLRVGADESYRFPEAFLLGG